MGINTPAIAAAAILMTMAAQMTRAISQVPNHAQVASATTVAQIAPFRAPTESSLKNSQRALELWIWPSAMPRMIRVTVCVPAMPPMLATTGISTASATIWSMVASKSPTTQDAMNAVTRLMPSQSARRLALLRTPAKTSSSSSRPAAASRGCSACSRTTSSTSSIVTRPSSRRSGPMMAAESRSRPSNSWATSAAGVAGSMPATSESITAETIFSSSSVSRRVTGKAPRYRSLRSTTNRQSVLSGSSPRMRR